MEQEAKSALLAEFESRLEQGKKTDETDDLFSSKSLFRIVNNLEVRTVFLPLATCFALAFFTSPHFTSRPRIVRRSPSRTSIFALKMTGTSLARSRFQLALSLLH